MKKHLDSVRPPDIAASEIKNPQSSISPNNSNTSQSKSPTNAQKNQQEPNKEQKAQEDALSQAIVTEKPNVKWDDVAGLLNAKKSL